MRYKDRPDPNYPFDEATGNLIMPTELIIEGDTIMFSDIFPGATLINGNNISLTIVTKDKEKTRRYFELLSDKGEVDMELQETFWSPLYGSLIDRFGIFWQFSTAQYRSRPVKTGLFIIRFSPKCQIKAIILIYA